MCVLVSVLSALVSLVRQWRWMHVGHSSWSLPKFFDVAVKGYLWHTICQCVAQVMVPQAVSLAAAAAVGVIS